MYEVQVQVRTKGGLNRTEPNFGNARRKEEPILSNTQEETVCCGREEAVRQRKRPFIERKEAVRREEAVH